ARLLGVHLVHGGEHGVVVEQGERRPVEIGTGEAQPPGRQGALQGQSLDRPGAGGESVQICILVCAHMESGSAGAPGPRSWPRVARMPVLPGGIMTGLAGALCPRGAGRDAEYHSATAAATRATS